MYLAKNDTGLVKKAQNFPLSPKTCLFNPKNRGNYNEKEVAISRNLLIFSAPAGI